MQVNPQIVLVIFNQTLKLTENGLIELKNRSLYSDSSSRLDGTNWIVQSKIYKPMKSKSETSRYNRSRVVLVQSIILTP